MTDILWLLIVVFLVLHGLTHVLWFLAAWTPIKTGIKDEPWVLPGDVMLTGLVGRIIGLIALFVMGLLLFAALVLLLQEPWWRGVARWGAILSMFVVLPWWPHVPRRIGLQAIVADIVLLFIVALPLSIEII